MKKPWKEVTILTEEQKAIIAPNPEMDGIVLTLCEVDEPKKYFGIYLSYDEAIELGKELINYGNQNKQNN